MSTPNLQKFPIFYLLRTHSACRLRQGENINAPDRAALGAFAATNAFFGIDRGEKIRDLNGLIFAHPSAFHAADAAGRACLSHNRPLIMAGAAHHAFCAARQQRNQPLRTNRNTFAAPAAKRRIDAGEAVVHRNSPVFAHRTAVAVTQAAVIAFSVGAVKLICRRAGRHSLLVQLARRMRLTTAAAHHRRFDLHRTGHTEQRRGFLCRFGAAG